MKSLPAAFREIEAMMEKLIKRKAREEHAEVRKGVYFAPLDVT
jgi:hypothetical protein